MTYTKLTLLAAASVIGTALIAAPHTASAKMGGMSGGGMRGHSGFAAAHIGGTGGFARSGVAVARPAFVNRPVLAHHAFFPHRRFVRPFFGVGAVYAAGYSCWRWVPTAYGLQRVWACDYPYYGDY